MTSANVSEYRILNKSGEQVKIDLEHQENNKKLLNNIRGYRVNPKGWGGIYE